MAQCITQDGVPKKWYDKVWTIGASGNGEYIPCREMMRDCKFYEYPTKKTYYRAWDDYGACQVACAEFKLKYATP